MGGMTKPPDLDSIGYMDWLYQAGSEIENCEMLAALRSQPPR